LLFALCFLRARIHVRLPRFLKSWLAAAPPGVRQHHTLIRLMFPAMTKCAAFAFSVLDIMHSDVMYDICRCLETPFIALYNTWRELCKHSSPTQIRCHFDSLSSTFCAWEKVVCQALQLAWSTRGGCSPYVYRMHSGVMLHRVLSVLRCAVRWKLKSNASSKQQSEGRFWVSYADFNLWKPILHTLKHDNSLLILSIHIRKRDTALTILKP